MLISGSLASKQVPNKASFPLTFPIEQILLKPRYTGSGTQKLLGCNGQKRPPVIGHEIQ